MKEERKGSQAECSSKANARAEEEPAVGRPALPLEELGARPWVAEARLARAHLYWRRRQSGDEQRAFEDAGAALAQANEIDQLAVVRGAESLLEKVRLAT